MMPAADAHVLELANETLHRHLDAVASAKHALGPWPLRRSFAELSVSGIYAASADGASWIVSTSTTLGPLALVVWTMSLGAGRKPLLRRELIGEVGKASRAMLTLFWRSDIDANHRLPSDEAVFAEAHELTERARITAAIEVMRAVVGECRVAPGPRSSARLLGTQHQSR